MRCKPAGNSFVFKPNRLTKAGGMGQGSGISKMPCRKWRRIKLLHNHSRRKTSEMLSPPSEEVKNAFAWLQLVLWDASDGWPFFATILQMPFPPQLELGEPNMTSHWKSIVPVCVRSCMAGRCEGFGRCEIEVFVLKAVRSIVWITLYRFDFLKSCTLSTENINYDDLPGTVTASRRFVSEKH